jgi:hypothetical protein
VARHRECNLAGLIEFNLMYARTRAQRRSSKQKNKNAKLSHLIESLNSFVRLREASKVYGTTLETQSLSARQANYSRTRTAGF